MSAVRLASSTQRIIVHSPSSVDVVGAGPVGPRGFPGNQVIKGTIVVANTSWFMTHNLGLGSASDLNPAVWWFEDENGVPMEPADLQYVNPNIALAVWLLPVRGTWRLS